METLKYTIIKNKEQYDNYCNLLEELILQENDTTRDEIELLTLLIEKWDTDHTTLNNADPLETLKYLMAEHGLKSKDLGDILGLTKGTISKILNYNKGLSKETIRKLSEYFKVSHETFNRHYLLMTVVKKPIQSAGTGKIYKKKIEV